MKIHEFQAKQILARFGVPVPRGEVVLKAADAAVKEAAKTLRGISGAHVVSMSAVVEGDRITAYRTTVDIAFGIER